MRLRKRAANNSPPVTTTATLRVIQCQELLLSIALQLFPQTRLVIEDNQRRGGLRQQCVDLGTVIDTAEIERRRRRGDVVFVDGRKIDVKVGMDLGNGSSPFFRHRGDHIVIRVILDLFEGFGKFFRLFVFYLVTLDLEGAVFCQHIGENGVGR